MATKLYDQTNNARDELFSSLGDVDPDVISHLINPAFMGGPQWPALRQAFSVIRSEGSIKIASNGLSDPFDGEETPNNGFRLEIIAETREELGANVADSWLFRLVYSVSQQAAHSGQMADFLAKHGVITMELYAEDDGLELFQDESGMVGIMIGVESPTLPQKVSFPGEDIFLATVQVLTPDELAYVRQHRAEARNELHHLMQQSGQYHVIAPGRDSLLSKSKTSAKKPWWKFGK